MKQHLLTHKTREGGTPSTSNNSSNQPSPNRLPREDMGANITPPPPLPPSIMNALPLRPMPTPDELRAAVKREAGGDRDGGDEPAPKKHGKGDGKSTRRTH